MPAPPIPANDGDRLTELERYRILDTPPEASFDELTSLAAYICQTPVSLISLVDKHRQWFKSICGLDVSETPRKQAFCGYTILDNVPFIVEDALVDVRVQDNPLVQLDPKIRFYAGIPLMSPRGYNLGSLCVIDFIPNKLNQKQINGLKTLASQVVHLLEARLFSEKITHYTNVLEKAHAEALQANQAKSQFLAMISHDIRTPLYGIIGALDLLSDSQLSAQQQQHLDTANTSAHMLQSIISNVLDFSKIEANKLTLNPTSTSLINLSRKIQQVLQDEITQKQLQFSIDIESSIPERVSIDKSRLSQVLLNLCSNAVKFTPPTGSIVLKCSLQQLSASNVTVQFCVSDTGIGIARDQQQSIFSPFVQADNYTYHEHGGTGLGLAISSRLLELMGSHLQVQSTLGEGASFYFTLTCPIMQAQPGKVVSKKTFQEILRCLDHSIHVLVAEDNPVSQHLLQHLLEKNGCIVSLVNNGQEACQQFLEHAFDLVLMDLEMPVMGGEEAAQKIFDHCQQQQKKVPIIMLTAHAIAETQERLINKGIDGYLTKPIRAQELLDAIASVLNC
ncbi:hybrid sensor histidine kinase/response regulator [Leptothoe spongobia]|uniref:Circadian input-output histidine kinase CikA n=1 Tax=Leptothoe spongobia TAU-MAC 1115 TaxID=1967444 RepID=A0A947DKY1_9CYAN|nr:hybrid sensor histidine kinase/response regulator [Leptothoe spongobia]MBT9317571.1 response regulator [Leptothoe spongobia TAU-MAC 1115]